MIRIAIFDDHGLIGSGLHQFFSEQEDYVSAIGKPIVRTLIAAFALLFVNLLETARRSVQFGDLAFDQTTSQKCIVHRQAIRDNVEGPIWENTIDSTRRLMNKSFIRRGTPTPFKTTQISTTAESKNSHLTGGLQK